MSLPVVLIPEARAEFDEAFDCVNARRRVLELPLQITCSRCSTGSLRPQRSIGSFVRTCAKAGVRRFPYSVYYRTEATRIVVLAVFHGKRDPRVWQARS